MSAVDEIQAAIDKLTALKTTTTTGPWVGWRKCDPLRGTLFGIEARETDVAKTCTPQDAELIEVLHATIDPLIFALKRGLLEAKKDSDRRKFTNVTDMLAIAHSINGTI